MFIVDCICSCVIPVTTKYKALIPMVTTTKRGFFKSDFTSVHAEEKCCIQDWPAASPSPIVLKPVLVYAKIKKRKNGVKKPFHLSVFYLGRFFLLPRKIVGVLK